MSLVHVLFHQSDPVAAFPSASAAMEAIHDLPSWADPDLFLVAVPYQPQLVAGAGTVGAATEAGERRASGAAGPGPVTLSPNGHKCE